MTHDEAASERARERASEILPCCGGWNGTFLGNGDRERARACFGGWSAGLGTPRVRVLLGSSQHGARQVLAQVWVPQVVVQRVVVHAVPRLERPLRRLAVSPERAELVLPVLEQGARRFFLDARLQMKGTAYGRDASFERCGVLGSSVSMQ
jgi:hypothetical protein